MAVDRIISSDDSINENSKGLIGTDSVPIENESADTKIISLSDRISFSTESKGLKELPDRFDDSDGDWKIIKSSSPFEILYLDYKQYKIISTEIVKNNYDILLKFWSDKVALMNTGGNRVAFSKKFGEKTIETSIDTLKKAYDKINSAEGIENYYLEINNARLNEGKNKLNKELKPILADKIIDISEMEYLFSNASAFELSDDECALIIEKMLIENELISKGKVSGFNLKEQLLSVRWMTQDKLTDELQRDKERDNAKIKLLGKYASTIEEIGSILFENPLEAKEIIKEDLLKQSISQKDIDVARVVGNICKNAKNIDLAYIEVIYKLNNTLPYRFSDQKITTDISELCLFFAENNKSIISGKEHIKKGFVEIWLKETNKEAYNTFLKIRDTAANSDLAFLEFLYTFNPKLPYLFADSILINTPEELFTEINKSKETWNAGKKELFNSSIIIWLKTIGKNVIIEKWNNIINNSKNQDIGLEEFLHIIDNKTEYAKINVDYEKISFPKIQSGKTISIDIIFTNETRGYSEGSLSFSKTLPGVSLSINKICHNKAEGIIKNNVRLTIDSNFLLKGVGYETLIQFVSSTRQKIDIPVSFKVVFPTNAFIIEAVKYSAVVSVFFTLIRLIISTAHKDWLNKNFNYFLSWFYADISYKNFAIFGWTFLLFISFVVLGTYLIIRYLIKKPKPPKSSL